MFPGNLIQSAVLPSTQLELHCRNQSGVKTASLTRNAAKRPLNSPSMPPSPPSGISIPKLWIGRTTPQYQRIADRITSRRTDRASALPEPCENSLYRKNCLLEKMHEDLLGLSTDISGGNIRHDTRTGMHRRVSGSAPGAATIRRRLYLEQGRAFVWNYLARGDVTTSSTMQTANGRCWMNAWIVV